MKKDFFWLKFVVQYHQLISLSSLSSRMQSFIKEVSSDSDLKTRSTDWYLLSSTLQVDSKFTLQEQIQWDNQ